MKNKFLKDVCAQISAVVEAEEKEPLTLEFGGEELPPDNNDEIPDSQLSGDNNLLSDIEVMVPGKIKDLVDKVPSSIIFALGILLGGSKLSLAMQTIQSNKLMRNFFFNVLLLLAMKREETAVEGNIRKLLSAQSAKAAMDRLNKIYDNLIANKEPDKMDLNILHNEIAKLIKSMPPVVLMDIKDENNAQ